MAVLCSVAVGRPRGVSHQPRCLAPCTHGRSSANTPASSKPFLRLFLATARRQVISHGLAQLLGRRPAATKEGADREVPEAVDKA